MPKMGNEFDFLRTSPEHIAFHSSRIMFWVIDGDIKSYPQGTPISHLEIAEKEGWVNGENARVFFEKNMRGFILISDQERRIHFYKGVGFGFDERVISEARRLLPKFLDKFELSSETKVYFGPKDTQVNGKEYPVYFVGTIGNFLFSE